jgi:hypothetical protein
MKPAIALFLGLVLAVSSARAENSVVIESKTFYAGQKDRIVGIHITNDIAVTHIYLPLELREVTPGAYPAHKFAFEENPSGRIYSSLLGPNSPEPRNKSRWYFPTPTANTCSGPLSHTWSTHMGGIDFSSPDAVFWYVFGYQSGTWGYPELTPGVDPPGTENASYQLRFDVSTTPGLFEIDSCCAYPNNKITLYNQNRGLYPQTSFSKGVITIAPCSCPCAADPVCDSAHDISDVTALIDVAFRGVPDISDSTCSVSRTDVNADGQTDVVDVVRLILVAFMEQPAETYFGNPCQ